MQEAFNPKVWEEIQKQFDKIKEDSGIEPDDETQKQIEDMLGISFDEMDEEFGNQVLKKTIQIKKLNPDAILPNYNYESDSGFDLYSTETIIIPPFGRVAVSTGISVKFDIGLELQVRPKSGLALNLGLTVLNTPGTVDQGYSGEIKVIIFNTNPESVSVERGMKIAQGVLCPVLNGKFVDIIEVEEFEDGERGDNAFGSTGI